MSALGLVSRYLARHKLRTFCTVLGIAVTMLLFLLLRTTVAMWSNGAEHAAQDRQYTRHKVSFALKIPRRYADDVRSIPSVRAATWAVWMGLKDPRNAKVNFASYAVDAPSVFDVYQEIALPIAERQAFLDDVQGLVLGDALAKRLGVRVGDHITLDSPLYPGPWEFHVRGIYGVTRRSFDPMSAIMHFRYLDESRPASLRGDIGWITSRVDDSRQSAAVSAGIDRHFADRDIQTVTMSERATNESFLSFMGAILAAVQAVSLILLAIMGLTLGNTLSMSVRESIRDFATFQAIGFSPEWVASLIVLQALVLAGLGAGLGAALAVPLVDFGIGRFIEQNMASIFPSFTLDLRTALLASALVVVCACVASLPPLLQLLRVPVIDGLRKVA